MGIHSPCNQAPVRQPVTLAYPSFSPANINNGGSTGAVRAPHMNPNLFLEDGDDSFAMLSAMVKAADYATTSADRQALLRNAGVNMPSLRLDGGALDYAQRLVAAFKNFCVSERRPDYHPMLLLVRYLVWVEEQFRTYNFTDVEFALLEKMLAAGGRNLKALELRRAVGMIEDAHGKGIGTGTHIGGGRLLTCDHVFTKTGVTRARVKFGYKHRCGGGLPEPGTAFELDLDNPVVSSARPDFAVLRIKGAPPAYALTPSPSPVSGGEQVRLIHHPGGRPVEVSDPGEVVQVGDDYADHLVPTEEGSSGAPVFNQNWELVALHRGKPGVARAAAQGAAEALPVRAIWDSIK